VRRHYYQHCCCTNEVVKSERRGDILADDLYERFSKPSELAEREESSTEGTEVNDWLKRDTESTQGIEVDGVPGQRFERMTRTGKSY
jgi:hypothetical protein